MSEQLQQNPEENTNPEVVEKLYSWIDTHANEYDQEDATIRSGLYPVKDAGLLPIDSVLATIHETQEGESRFGVLGLEYKGENIFKIYVHGETVAVNGMNNGADLKDFSIVEALYARLPDTGKPATDTTPKAMADNRGQGELLHIGDGVFEYPDGTQVTDH